MPNEKASELKGSLIKLGGELLVKILPNILAKKIKLTQQSEPNATFCKKIKKEDGLVDFGADLPNVLYNKFRAYATWPRIFFFQNGKRIIITDATLEDNKFVIKKVLAEGKKEIKYEEFNRKSKN